MRSIQTMGVVFGVTLLAGCAGGAQPGVAYPASPTNFESAATLGPATAPSESASPGPFVWSRVEPRFHIHANNLAVEVGNFSRGAKLAPDAAPALRELAEALDAVPRLGGEHAGGAADAIRATGEELGRNPLDARAQRRATRAALLVAAQQMTIDAHGTYAAAPEVARAAAELRRAAEAISETGPDAEIEDGLVAAREGISAFERAIARGLVAIPSG